MVTARGLVRTFGEGRAARRVLDGAELEVEAGEIVAVLGRSGSGKSTLLHVLGGLDRPEAGVVEVAGARVTGAGERRLSALRRRHIGFVFQFFHLLPELTGEANVLLAGRVRGADADALARGRALVDRLGLRPVAGSLPHQLSGGEQQRFAIARALVNDPALLLADEPTGNLDVEAGAAVLALLRELAAEGRAVVLVTHEATRGGDRRPRAAARRRPAGGGVIRPRTRTVLAALGIFAASLVVGTAATVGYGLATGFDRAAREADLPDVIARFDRESRETVDERVRALPNLAARSYRHEEKNIGLRANGHGTRKGVVHIVTGGRRGYAVTEGRDLRGPDEVLVERGLAREWGLAPGDGMEVFGGWDVRIVGVARRAGQRRVPADGHAAHLHVGVVVGPPGVGQPRAALARRRRPRGHHARPRRGRPRSASATSRSSRARGSRCCSARRPGS